MKFSNTHEVVPLPSALRYYMTSDWATMEPKKGKHEPDFTEHAIWGMDPKGQVYAMDWWSLQAETDKGADAFINMVRKWKPLKAWNEGGLIDKALAPHLRKTMRDTKVFTILEAIPSMLDKGLKLQAFHSLVSNGMIYFPVGTPWAERVIDQLVKFPGGRWDDAADCCGLVGRALDQMFDASVTTIIPRKIIRPFTEEWMLAHDQPTKPKVRYFS